MRRRKKKNVPIRIASVLLALCLSAGCAGKTGTEVTSESTDPIREESSGSQFLSEEQNSDGITEENSSEGISEEQGSENTSEKRTSPEETSEETSSKEEAPAEETSSKEEAPAEEILLLRREDWAADVKQGLNEFLLRRASEKDTDAYVVFDFDNTCSIFDTQVELFVYQTEHMAYALDPEEMRTALLSNLRQADLPDDAGLTERDWIEDILAAYGKLWDSYGPFTPEGLSEEKAQQVRKDPYYREFFVKMKALYSKVSAVEGAEISCFWLHSAFSGMTREEVYHLASECFRTHSRMDSSYVTEVSPDPALIPSRTGRRSTNVTRGIYVTENIRELMRALDAAGVDIYVCSASMDLTVMAAVDSFGLREYVTAVLGVSNRTEESQGTCVLTAFPAENGGYAWYPGNGTKNTEGEDTETFSWSEGTLPLTAMPQGPGKVTAIEHAIRPYYGRGPAAGFMDSAGDFNFCTEYASLELVVCFNRGWRYVTDGGGLVAEVALLQASRGETLQSAFEKGDTLYLLQGRDESGRGSLIADHGSVHLVPDAPAVYRILENDSNEQMLQYMKDHSLSAKEAFDRFALRTEAGGENPFSFRYGFLDTYEGYHSRT